MSWSRRGARGAAVAAALALGLAGCGFEPLYGERARAVGQAQLASIYIAPLKDRDGQVLHNALLNAITPAGFPAEPRYRLETDLDVRTRELGIRKDETATRANMIFTARFRLRDARSGDVLLRGVSESVNSVNILESQFATIASEQDATRRAARSLSQSIKTRIAIWLRQNRQAGRAGRP